MEWSKKTFFLTLIVKLKYKVFKFSTITLTTIQTQDQQLSHKYETSTAPKDDEEPGATKTLSLLQEIGKLGRP